MNRKIGDEEYSEEINTSYDQEQPIGDTPSDYPAAGAEPIDATTGQDFLDIPTGSKDYQMEKLGCKHCGDPTADLDTDEEGYQSCRYCDKEFGQIGETLNKDGTGVANARRGIDPNNKKHGVMKFDYVSQSGCDICAPYDGMTFARDSPNRPVIPRLEKGGDGRPFTHPNCKCRWTKVFTESVAIELKPDTIIRARKWYGGNFDQLTELEQKVVIVDMLESKLGIENDKPFSKWTKDDLYRSECQSCGAPLEEHPIKGDDPHEWLAEQPSDYEGDMSPANEGGDIWDSSSSWYGRDPSKCSHGDIEDDYCKLCDASRYEVDDGIFEGDKYKLGKTYTQENKSNEYGIKGVSGKSGHKKWMLEGEASGECENCMINTDRDDNGKCILCGN